MTEYRECVQCGVESRNGEDICDACFELDDGTLAAHIGHALYQTKDMRKLQGCSDNIAEEVPEDINFAARCGEFTLQTVHDGLMDFFNRWHGLPLEMIVSEYQAEVMLSPLSVMGVPVRVVHDPYDSVRRSPRSMPDEVDWPHRE